MVENIYFGIILSFFVTATNGAYCSYYNSYGSTSYKYCSSSCCGSKSDRYCCSSYNSNSYSSGNSNAGAIVGVVLGIIALVGIIGTVLVIIFCCCRKTRGQTGQVFQPAVPAYGVQTTTVTAGYGQVGYTNAAFPQQLQTSNLSAENAPKWQEPPPPYSTANPN